MYDNLSNLVRQNAGDAVISNPAIPNEKNEAAVETASSSIMDTIKKALASGNISDVFSYFKNGQQGSPALVQEATDTYAHDLQNKLGVPPPEAQKAASALIPQTMQQMAAKTADPADKSFNVQDIFNKLSGNKTSGFNMQEMLNKFTGGKLDKDKDGQVDFGDLKAIFSGGGGGLVDKVKGMFK